MANNFFGLAFNYPSTAEMFRTFGSTISAQLSAMLTKEVTTSDIDWLNVPSPYANAYATTFEVYRFNDAAQTTYPLFLKFEYGMSTNGISLRLTIGKSCDAAGVLSGIILPPTDVIYNIEGADATLQNCYISNGSGSSLALALYPTASTMTGGGFIIERAYAPNGSIDGSALLIGYKPYGSRSDMDWTHVMVDYTTATFNTITASGLFPTPITLNSGVSLANGSITPYFPAACMTPTGKYWIPRVALGGAAVDCAAGVVINSLLDGFTYMGIGNLGGKSDQRSTSFSGMLIRW